MSEDVIHFMPQAGVVAQENVQQFIALARDILTAFGPGLRFSENRWDITEAARLRGKNHRVIITFCTLETVNAVTTLPMAQPFGDFAKAYIRYMQGLKPAKNPHFRLSALRVIDQVLTEFGFAGAVHRIDAHVLNQAAQVIKKRYSASAAYRIGGQMEILAVFLTAKRLVTVPVIWRNSLNRPNDTVRVGAEFEKRREEKMPSARALEAVAIVFRTTTHPADQVAVGAIALMCAAPDRVGEVLTLKADCEVTVDRRDKEPAYGLRWWPEKGAEPTIKWILPMMQGVVQDALVMLRRNSDSARKVAAWYEENPGEVFLPDGLEYLRGRELQYEDVAEIVGQKSGNQFCRIHKIPTYRRGARDYLQFRDIERAVIDLLPNGFPLLDPKSDTKYSEAMFVALRHRFRHNLTTPMPCMIEAVTHGVISDALGNRVGHGVQSVFSRLDLTEEDGTPIAITSHQFRHYLNTLAQKGGMSQLDIAKWSGRKDVRQNRAYDHVSAEEMIGQIQASVGNEDELFGPPARVDIRLPVSRAKFEAKHGTVGHTTEIGFCEHDFTMLPCQLHRDCINCIEHVCVKGDAKKTLQIHRQLDDARRYLDKAQDGVREGFEGADRWRDHYRETVARLEELCRLLDDPDVPDGTNIKLKNPLADSPIRLADRQHQGLPQRGIDLDVLSDLMNDQEDDNAAA